MDKKSYAKTVVINTVCIVFFCLLILSPLKAADAPIIVDHTCTDIWQVPESAIQDAKASLHIAYGHTSHGSQLISGMGRSGGAPFDEFMSSNGATPGLYLWNNGGNEGALDLHDNFVSGDLGNPDRVTWAQRTRDYLNNPDNSDVNVIIWSWCGQANTTIDNIDIYLDLMEGLINDYPDVHFVFMTGHLAGTGAEGQLNLANEHIRNHCRANNRILYDFADIESYDPDGLVNYMELNANDNCDYDSDNNGTRDTNWARNWQESHVEGVDWWPSGAAHSQHLNGNRKGYAAWWLWATLAGWNQTSVPCAAAPSELSAELGIEQSQIDLAWTDNSTGINETEFIIHRRVNSGSWDNDYARVSADTVQFSDVEIGEGSYEYRVQAYFDGGIEGEPCYSSVSNTASVSISTQPPADPSDLTASLADSGVEVSWADNSDNEDEFVLERSTNSEGFVELTRLSQDTTTYLDDTVVALNTYTYRVKAGNTSGESGYSNEESVTVPEQSLSFVLKQGVDEYYGCTDTYLDEGNPSTTYGTTQYKRIGGSTQVNYAVKFELPEELGDKIIHDAKLVVYCWTVSSYSEGNEFELHEITESWDENTATWVDKETEVAWASPGGICCSTPVVTVPILSSAHYPEFDVTELVKQWAAGTKVNNGMMLMNTSTVSTGIKASEYSEYGRPYLEIQYSNAPACENDQDGDSDVDGMDIATYVLEFNGDCLESFANEFGNN